MVFYFLSGLVIDQARKDGFQFRNVGEAVPASANNRSLEEDPQVNGIPEIEGKEESEKVRLDS